jgi:hypothetical protein
MEHWEEMLDEFALHPGAMTWFDVPATLLGMLIAEQFEAVHTLVERGYLAWAGVRCDQWKDTLYRITPAGRAYWEENIKGKRRRPAKAPPVPRWTTAQIAAATSPTSVWDLARVPFVWKKQET